jgi:hypothetical protein
VAVVLLATALVPPAPVAVLPIVDPAAAVAAVAPLEAVPPALVAAVLVVLLPSSPPSSPPQAVALATKQTVTSAPARTVRLAFFPFI